MLQSNDNPQPKVGSDALSDSPGNFPFSGALKKGPGMMIQGLGEEEQGQSQTHRGRKGPCGQHHTRSNRLRERPRAALNGPVRALLTVWMETKGLS